MAVAAAENYVVKFRQLGSVPTLPAAATRALAVVNDPNSNARDLSRIIESDPALATSLLKMVNSSFYGGGQKITNLNMAVSRLGMRQTQNLILAVSVRSVFRWMPKTHEKERDRLWRMSSLTGVLCRQVNEKLGLGFTGEEFTCGMSNDLGRILFCVGYPDVFAKLAEIKSADESAVLLEEERLLGFTHIELGAWLLEVWNMPSELVETVRHYNNPESAPRHPVLAAVVSVGKAMALYMEHTKKTDGIDLSSNPGWRYFCTQWSNVADLDVGMFASAVMNDALPEAEALSLVDMSA
jgi:HD-like signal output (HDOD) protein